MRILEKTVTREKYLILFLKILFALSTHLFSIFSYSANVTLPAPQFVTHTTLIPFVSKIGGDWLGINVGANAQITPSISLFVNGSYENRVRGINTFW